MVNFIAQSSDLDAYLAETEVIDYQHPIIAKISDALHVKDLQDIELVERCFAYVRDHIPHSWDIQSTVVTRKASEVAEQRTGICYAKSNLLAALLRRNGIPCGFCYQRLMIFDTPEKGYSLHAFNGVYIPSLKKWIVLDSRGNKPGVDAAFSIDKPQLAFVVDEQMEEQTYPMIFVEPNDKTMAVLQQAKDSIEMYKYQLPDQL